MILTERTLPTLLRFWQLQLGLHGWTITARKASRNELPHTVGEVKMLPQSTTARILILHERDWDPQELIPQDQEQTLVHELLEIQLSPLTDGLERYQELFKEQAIEAQAKALVTLRRSGLAVCGKPVQKCGKPVQKRAVQKRKNAVLHRR
jgi:hypothetical protein